jgi:hypothetical protein
MSAIFGLYYSLPHLPSIVQRHKALWSSTFPDILQHYSSPAGAIGILETGKLWATNAKYMNDAQELSYGLDLVVSVLSDRYSRAGGLERSWLAQAERLVSDMLASNSVYLGCFCETRDLLSQWRGYGPHGGVALGFDAHLLARSDETLLIKVKYEPEEQRRIVEETLAAYEEELTAATGSTDDLAAFHANPKLGVALALLVVSFKHPKFAEEQEWRVVPLTIPPIRIRIDEGWIRPYVELSLRSTAVPVLPLREVTIGPGRHAELSGQSVKMLLEREGLKGVPVRMSNVPLR